MKVAIYARCSSDKQEDLDRSIPAQLGALRDYVAKNGYSVYKEYVEPGQSAYGDDENRERFHEMIRDAKEGKFDAVIVHRYNRFYRDQYKSLFYKKILRDNGVKVISITEELDPESIQGFMLERMIEMMDQVSSMQNAWETMKGMVENAKQGYKNGGRVPYGYRRVEIAVDVHRPNPKYKVKWEIEPEKAEVVRKIFALRCEGNSLRKITDYLNHNLIPSPTGKLWDISTIRYFFIKSDMYAGDYIWNFSDMKTRGKKWKDKKEWVIVKDAHPAIIDRKTAQKAKIALGKSNNTKYISSDSSKYILTGKNIFGGQLFKCKKCGSNYIGYETKGGSKKRYYSYACSSYLKKGRLGCFPPFHIAKDWLENKVIEEINNRYKDSRGIKELIARLLEGEMSKENEIGTLLKKVEAEIRKVNFRIDKLTESIFAGVDKSILVPKSKELAKRLEELEEKKKQLLADKDTKEKINIANIIKLFTDFKQIIGNGSYQQQHYAIKTFLKDIVVDPDQKEINLSFFELPSSELVSNRFGGGTRLYTQSLTKRGKRWYIPLKKEGQPTG